MKCVCIETEAIHMGGLYQYTNSVVKFVMIKLKYVIKLWKFVVWEHEAMTKFGNYLENDEIAEICSVRACVNLWWMSPTLSPLLELAWMECLVWFCVGIKGKAFDENNIIIMLS